MDIEQLKVKKDENSNTKEKFPKQTDTGFFIDVSASNAFYDSVFLLQ